MKSKKIKLNIIRWVARVTGNLLAVSILIFGTFSIVDESNNSDKAYSVLQILVFLLWGVALLALLLANWKEGWGGLISLTSLVLMYIAGLFIPEANKSAMLVVVMILAIPSLLYIYYWWKTKNNQFQIGDQSSR